jgi:hypothetical protein
MPSPPPEKLIENIRRKLGASIPHYAPLLPDMRHGDVRHELVDLAATLGVDPVTGLHRFIKETVGNYLRCSIA